MYLVENMIPPLPGVDGNEAGFLEEEVVRLRPDEAELLVVEELYVLSCVWLMQTKYVAEKYETLQSKNTKKRDSANMLSLLTSREFFSSYILKYDTQNEINGMHV